jgi:hypothetical protein
VNIALAGDETGDDNGRHTGVVGDFLYGSPTFTN